nr:hypothetical protein [Rickettsia endosymbiont of Ceutorhynchus assimilis]
MSKEEIHTVRLADFKLAAEFSRTQFIRGGTAIFTKSIVDVEEKAEIRDLSVEKNIEICCIYVKNYDLYVISVYRSPSGSLNLFLDVLERSFNLVSQKKKIVLAGDFNIGFGSNSNEDCRFRDFINTYGFKQMFHVNTRGPNCLDNIFLNNFEELDQCITESIV